MTREEVETKHWASGDRIYVQSVVHVVRSGIFLGLAPLPWDGERWGVCLTYDGLARVVDWFDLTYIEAAEVTIPKAVLESVGPPRSVSEHGR